MHVYLACQCEAYRANSIQCNWSDANVVVWVQFDACDDTGCDAMFCVDAHGYTYIHIYNNNSNNNHHNNSRNM